jgi:hypothetical protein
MKMKGWKMKIRFPNEWGQKEERRKKQIQESVLIITQTESGIRWNENFSCVSSFQSCCIFVMQQHKRQQQQRRLCMQTVVVAAHIPTL